MRKEDHARVPGRRSKADADGRSIRTGQPSPSSPDTGGLEAALSTAIQFVVSRLRTAHEVRQKLVRSGVSEAVIASVIAQLHERRLLDDAAYTKAYLASRLSHRGYGPQRLSRELHQRGVGRALIEEAVQHNLDADDVLTAARGQAAKRWARLARDADPAKRRQKLYDFLRRRGFAAAIVQQVLTELVKESGPD